jgi:hypothetical protein
MGDETCRQTTRERNEKILYRICPQVLAAKDWRLIYFKNQWVPRVVFLESAVEIFNCRAIVGSVDPSTRRPKFELSNFWIPLDYLYGVEQLIDIHSVDNLFLCHFLTLPLDFCFSAC